MGRAWVAASAAASWFIGCGLGFVSFWYLERVRPIITDLDRDLDTCRDGSSQAVMSGAESGVTVGTVTANAGAVTAGGETAPEPA
jgi:hypothetical protein